MDMYILLYSEWITSKDLLDSTWNSDQCYGAACWEGVWGRRDMWTHVYVLLSPFAGHWKLPQDC